MAEIDLAPFFALNTHPEVVAALGSSPTRAESDALAARCAAELAAEGWGPWALEIAGGARFAGLVGLHRVNDAFPFAPAVEVLWRLLPDHWGAGYATEAAAASLRHGFTVGGLGEVVAFTTTRNRRSQAVMGRLGMVRNPADDFDHPRLAAGDPLRRHVLFRVSAAQLPSTLLT